MRAEFFEGDPAEWEAFVAEHGWVYQSHAFGEVIRRGLRQRVVRLAVRDGVELRAVASVSVIVSPLFGRFGVSLPVSDHSGVCSVDPRATATLLEACEVLARRHGLAHVELRHLETPPGVALPSRGHKVTMQLALPGDREALWSTLKAKVRNLVRKGEKAELTYRRGGVELLDDFYAVYAQNLRDLGTPCYPRRLFREWLERFDASAEIHVALLPTGDVTAVGFTFRHRDRQQIPFAASRREHRAISPNMFLYWNMLGEAIDAGCTEFDFGRSTRESGTWRFKRQWGAEEQELLWHRCAQTGDESDGPSREDDSFGLAMRLWQKLPVPVATLVGSRLVRYLP